MTVVATIPYKGGVVITADSRGTMAPPLPVVVFYWDRMKKMYVTRNRSDMVITIQGGAEIADAAAHTLMKSEGLLKDYCAETNKRKKAAMLKELERRLADSTKDCRAIPFIGNISSALLVALRLDDGTIKTFEVEVEPAKNVFTEPKAKLTSTDWMPIADGLDGAPQDYLLDLAETMYVHSKMQLPDALTIAFLLQDRYAEEHYVLRWHGAKIMGAGGPMVLHVMSSDGRDLDMVVSKAERKSLENRSYGELRDYFEARAAQKLKQLEAEGETEPARALLRKDGATAQKRTGKNAVTG